MSGACGACGTNGAHYCPADLCGPDELPTTDEYDCPECGAVDAYVLGTIAYRDHYCCRDCGGEWSLPNYGAAKAAYDDACAAMHRKPQEP